MKTRTFTRILLLLLAVILGLSGLAAGGAITAQAASGDALSSYLFYVKWSGWSSGSKTFMNGWSHGAMDHWTIHCSYDNADVEDCKVCYCIEPGAETHTGKSYTEKDEDWFTENLLVNGFNDTIDGDTIKKLLGRIMQYGYTGGVDANWGTNPNGYKSEICQYIATQLLVWEVIVGERDEDFTWIEPPAGYDRIDSFMSGHPWASDLWDCYARISTSVKNHVGRPSFMAAEAADAQTVTMEWDGSKYSATLTDTNGVLDNFSFSASGGVNCSVSGNKLTLYAYTAPSGPVTITATKQATRKGLVVWYRDDYQKKISYGQPVDDPIRGYVNVEAEPKGTAQIVKDTTNGGDRSGWHFVLKDPSGNTMGPYVTDASGIIALDLAPGTYSVTETDGPYTYWVNDPEPTKTVTVVSGQTATVTFLNKWNGKAQIIKALANPEAGSLEGWPFTVQNSSGTTLGTYTTNASGEILLDLEPGNYTVTEILPENSIWECPGGITQTVTVTAGQTAVVTYTNTLRPGEIHIQKVDTQGAPLDGVEFLLEWSVDGISWSPVTYTDSAVPQIGGCTTEGLIDGKLTSGTDGLVIFTGLYPTLQYRLTETATRNGYQLLAEPAYTGALPADDLKISLKVVNAEIFTLPRTGAKSMALLPLGIFLCLAICAGAIVSLRRKEA